MACGLWEPYLTAVVRAAGHGWGTSSCSATEPAEVRVADGPLGQRGMTLTWLPQSLVMSSLPEVRRASGFGWRRATSATVASMAYLCPCSPAPWRSSAAADGPGRGAFVDVVELTEWLAERGCSVVFKADGERRQERRWMVIFAGGALGEEGFFRTSPPSADACKHLASRQIHPSPEVGRLSAAL